jgi:hypothetical protein
MFRLSALQIRRDFFLLDRPSQQTTPLSTPHCQIYDHQDGGDNFCLGGGACFHAHISMPRALLCCLPHVQAALLSVAAAQEFRLGGQTYASQEEFIQSGRRCGTPDLSQPDLKR